MTYYQHLIISFALLALVNCNPCDPSDTTYQGKRLPIISTSNSHTISGTLAPVDGCSFIIYNFILTPPALSTYFYGSATVSDSNAFRINKDLLGAYGGVDAKFNLTGEFGTSGTPSQMHSWSEFKVLKIISEQELSVLAYVILDPSGDDTTVKQSSDASIASFFTIWTILGIALAFFQ